MEILSLFIGKKVVFMTLKFLYMKFVGLLLVIVGFSYCLTSFYNFYDYIFSAMSINGFNISIMSLGLCFPLFVFIFGIYFYFYADKDRIRVNRFIMVAIVILMISALCKIVFSTNIIHNNLYFIAQLMEFIHISYGYVILVMCVFLIYGCFKYKF